MKKEEKELGLSKIIIDESLRKKTNSTIFLLPALGINKDVLNKFGFVNAYIDDAKCEPKYKNSLFLLLEPETSSEFHDFLQEQYEHPNFLCDYDVGKNQVILVYRFPVEYTTEYNNFKKGLYSKFSKRYVSQFFPMTKTEKKDGVTKKVSSVFSGIFNREEWLKKYWEEKLNVDILPDEYWSIPEDKKEIFRHGE